MKNPRTLLLSLVAAATAGSALLVAQQAPLPVSPTIRPSGQAVYGVYEGWYKNPDGSATLVMGYFNRNEKQTVDIPVGPANRIEPGGPDMGQPTRFGPRRQYGIFTIQVPKNFEKKRLTWTLTANGQTTSVDMHLDPNWVVEPFEDFGSGNKAPEIRFQPGGPAQFGPPTKVMTTYSARVGEPLTLTAFMSDVAASKNVMPPNPRFGQRPPITASWSQLRGPADVALDPARPSVEMADGGRVTTKATFTAPGEYILRLQANDASGEGGGGFQCCWTNAHVKVTVSGPSTPRATGGQQQ